MEGTRVRGSGMRLLRRRRRGMAITLLLLMLLRGVKRTRDRARHPKFLRCLVSTV